MVWFRLFAAAIGNLSVFPVREEIEVGRVITKEKANCTGPFAAAKG